jgi:hypothetical protein
VEDTHRTEAAVRRHPERDTGPFRAGFTCGKLV